MLAKILEKTLALYLTKAVKCGILYPSKKEAKMRSVEDVVNVNETILPKAETAVLAMRTLYESFGYTKYKMSKFEDYDLYRDNKRFLPKGEIITFPNRDGRLLALKPDVTLSIVKNAREGEQIREYYNENVYRGMDGEHREIMQVGLECIGEIDLYSTCEVIRLAKKTLSIICESSILDISHGAFVGGLLDAAGLPDDGVRDAFNTCIAGKNAHELSKLCQAYGVASDVEEKLCRLLTLYGPFPAIREEMQSLVVSEDMASAFREIEAIDNYFRTIGEDKGLAVDLSLVNDMCYYTGVLFKGYVQGVPAGVLSGGRYDGLLQRMQKNGMGAVGFAVYMNLLDLYFDEGRGKEYDVDILVTYDSGTDMAALSRTVDMLMGGGRSVRVQKQADDKLRYKEKFHFGERGLEIRD